MRLPLTFAAAAALIAVAACNSESAAPPDDQAPAAANVAAGTAGPEDAAQVMRARQQHYKEMGKAMKGIGDALKARQPDLAAIRGHAGVIAGYGPQLLDWFPEGSGAASGGETRAKDEIWSDAETFRAAAQRFEQVSAAFNRTAQGEDVDAIRAGLGELGASCKNCHDRFRGPER